MKILAVSAFLLIVSSSFGQQLQSNSRESKLEPVTTEIENSINIDEETESSVTKISKQKKRRKVISEDPVILNSSDPSSNKKIKP